MRRCATVAGDGPTESEVRRRAGQASIVAAETARHVTRAVAIATHARTHTHTLSPAGRRQSAAMARTGQLLADIQRRPNTRLVSRQTTGMVTVRPDLVMVSTFTKNAQSEATVTHECGQTDRRVVSGTQATTSPPQPALAVNSVQRQFVILKQ